MHFVSANPLLIVLVGPPGSGKSTWARVNGANAIHVSQDDLIDAITPSGFAHDHRPIYQAAEDAVARAGLAAGRTVIADRTNRTRAHRQRWVRIARELRATVVAVVMTTPHDICRARNNSRTDSRRLSQERMDRMFAAMEPVDFAEGFAAIYRAEEVTMQEILARACIEGKERFSDEYRYQT